MWFKPLFSLFKKDAHHDHIAHLDQKLVFALRKKYVPTPRQLKYANVFFSAREKVLVMVGLVLFIGGWILAGGAFVKAHRVHIPAVGGTYREGLIGSPQHFNPLFAARSSVDRTVSKLVFSSIMTYNEYGQLIPDLAESINIDDKQTTYTVHIKQNVQFHDGTPLTAHDIARTIELIKHEETKSSLRSQLFNVKPEVIDDYTLALTLENPFPQFEALLTFGILPAHIWNDIEPGDAQKASFNKHPIGSGPFIFQSTQTDTFSGTTTITLARNKQYHRTPPYLETIELKAVASAPQALDLLLKQEIDALGALNAQDINRLQKRTNQYALSVPEHTGIFFNQISNDALKRQAVRDALSATIDKQKIVRDALSGNATVAHSPFIPGMPGYIEGAHEYNPTQAEITLDDDKWERITEEEFIDFKLEEEKKSFIQIYKEINDGAQPSDEEVIEALSQKTAEIAATIDPLQPYFRKRNNTILELSLTYVDNSDAQATADIIKAGWRSIGVHVKPDPTPAAQLERDILASHRYEALLLGVVLGTNPDPFPLWFDAGNADRATLARFVDRSLDDLLESIRNTANETKREQLFVQFQNYVLNKKPAIILYNPTYHYAVVPRVKGISATHIITPPDRFAGITQWYIKEKKQWVW